MWRFCWNDMSKIFTNRYHFITLDVTLVAGWAIDITSIWCYAFSFGYGRLPLISYNPGLIIFQKNHVAQVTLSFDFYNHANIRKILRAVMEKMPRTTQTKTNVMRKIMTDGGMDRDQFMGPTFKVGWSKKLKYDSWIPSKWW